MKNAVRQVKKLEFLSSSSKIGVQIMWLTALVILPRLFPEIIELRYQTSLTINITLALASSAFYEFLKYFYRRRGRDNRWIVKTQLLTSALLLTWFLHVFGRINGPFFILFLLTVMESALNLDVKLPGLVVAIAAAGTVLEFGWLVFIGEIPFNLYFGLQVFIRLVALFFMRSYGISLAWTIISEREAKQNLEEATQSLKKANVKLKDLSELKDEFVSVASHELRAPMTTIKGYISMILEGDVGKIPPKVKEFLKDTYESNDRMIRLVNNMLNVSRIESGRMIMNLKDIRLEKIIEDVIKEYHLEADEHGIELKYEKPSEKLPEVRVDPDRIREIIANLVGNGINFTAKGHVIVRNKVENGMVITEVEDTGVGISSRNQKELFKKFSQVNGAQAPLRKGSGLGLYICKMLISEFSGEIWLKSKVGKGTTFFFSLPAINHQKSR